jgi:predicted lipid-binding transport protein (Tim44 family)
LNQQFRNRQLPTRNPLANLLVVVVGIIVISVSLALGFVVFVGIASFILVMAAIVTIRVWWAKRRFGAKKRGEAEQTSKPPPANQVIEGEFTEVSPPQKKNQRR